jgi:hypothetical protein
MAYKLMTIEIEIHPAAATPSFLATEQSTIE